MTGKLSGNKPAPFASVEAPLTPAEVAEMRRIEDYSEHFVLEDDEDHLGDDNGTLKVVDWP